MEQVDIEKTAALLKTLEPGFLPYPIFCEVARLTTLSTVEVVVFSKESVEAGDPKILLLQRPADDAWWPGMWHVGGAVLRATDAKGNFYDGFARVSQEYGAPFLQEPTFFRCDFRQETRGAMLGIQHYAIIDTSPLHGEFFRVHELPDTIVPEHVSAVAAATEKILTIRSSGIGTHPAS